MSGILGSIFSGIRQREGESSAWASILQQVLAQNGGGLNALLSRFEGAGLGTQAQSWVSTAPNQPISAEHIDQVFSQNEINAGRRKLARHPIRCAKYWQRHCHML